MGLASSCSDVESCFQSDGLSAHGARARRYRTYRYGDRRYSGERQFMRLHMPWVTGAACPLVILIHGGFWRQEARVESAAQGDVAVELQRAGFGVVELEYRPVEDEGGGFPGSCTDVLLAINALKRLKEAKFSRSRAWLDLERVILVGIDAGGQLALYAAHHLAVVAARGAQGGEGKQAIIPILVVGIAPCADLVRCYETHLSDTGDAVERFMSCTPIGSGYERYAKACASPILALLTSLSSPSVSCVRQRLCRHALFLSLSLSRSRSLARSLSSSLCTSLHCLLLAPSALNAHASPSPSPPRFSLHACGAHAQLRNTSSLCASRRSSYLGQKIPSCRITLPSSFSRTAKARSGRTTSSTPPLARGTLSKAQRAATPARKMARWMRKMKISHPPRQCGYSRSREPTTPLR